MFVFSIWNMYGITNLWSAEVRTNITSLAPVLDLIDLLSKSNLRTLPFFHR